MTLTYSITIKSDCLILANLTKMTYPCNSHKNIDKTIRFDCNWISIKKNNNKKKKKTHTKNIKKINFIINHNHHHNHHKQTKKNPHKKKHHTTKKKIYVYYVYIDPQWIYLIFFHQWYKRISTFAVLIFFGVVIDAIHVVIKCNLGMVLNLFEIYLNLYLIHLKILNLL